MCSATLTASALAANAGIIRVPASNAHQMPPMAVPQLVGQLHYMHTRNNQPVIPNACCKLTYGGGPVLLAPHMYVILWGFKAAGDPDKVGPLMKKFAKNIGGSSWLNTVTQYYSGSASSPNYITNPTHEGSVWEDDTNTEPAHATDAQIRAEAAAGAAHFGYDANGAYIVVSSYHHDPQGFLSSGWCAYHGATRLSSGNTISYTNDPYMPDAGGSCGANFVAAPSDESGTDEGVTIVTGHEYAESITDPQPFSGWNSSSGEIGDLCAWQDIANDPFGKKSYTMQPLYSNATLTCVQSYS
jgi:serine protease